MLEREGVYYKLTLVANPHNSIDDINKVSRNCARNAVKVFDKHSPICSCKNNKVSTQCVLVAENL